MTEALKNDIEPVLAGLEKVLPSRGRVLIIPHDYPDPDALASAAAVQLLLAKRYRVHGQIIFSGIVSRAENREILRHFRYSLQTASQWRPTPRPVPAVFVDTVPGRGNVTVPAGVKPVAVFDHHLHRGYRPPVNALVDINPNFGATSTRLFEYLQAAGIAMPRWLASIMAYAITTETFDFIRHASEHEIKAYTQLLSQCNLKTLGQIKNAPLPREYYGYLAEAVTNAHTYGRVLWTHLEDVKQPEIVAETADLLIRMERIMWSFCTGFTDDRLIVSIRSERPNPHCGRLLRSLIGRDEGSAGGHEQAAAGFVNVGALSATERIQRRNTLEERLLAKIEGRLTDNARPLFASEEMPAGPA